MGTGDYHRFSEQIYVQIEIGFEKLGCLGDVPGLLFLTSPWEVVYGVKTPSPFLNSMVSKSKVSCIVK